MRIVIACGGSGGHLMPGLSLGHHLERADEHMEVIYVAGRKPIEKKILNGKQAIFLPIEGIPTSIRRYPIFFVKGIVSWAISFAELLRLQPDGVVGFGGYVSGPVVMAALMLRKPVLLHEENVIPGRTNRWLSRWVKCITVAFEETRKSFPTHKVRCVGNPLRTDFTLLPSEEARRFLGLKEKTFTILLTGGSQGAHRLNRAMVQAMESVSPEERGDLQVIHLSGEKDQTWVRNAYETLGVSAQVHAYLEKMREAYCASDVVVSRGGAMTLAEVGHFQKPMILVPLSLANNHQMENGRYLASRGACILFEERKAMTKAFSDALLSLKRDSLRRKALSESLASCYPREETALFVQEVIQLGVKAA